MDFPILVFAHRRSGTHWVIDAIRNNFSNVSSWYYNLDKIESDNDFFIKLKEKTFRFSGHLILKSHSESNLSLFTDDKRSFVKDLLKNAKVIYVLRDGRDVLVSLYFYYKKVSKNKTLSFSDFIRQKDVKSEVNGIEYWKMHVDGWLSQKELNILPVSYEEMHFDYTKTLKKLEEFLEIPFRRNRIIEVSLKKYCFLQKALRRALPRFF